jgi:Protein of unknown function (DUF4197)
MGYLVQKFGRRAIVSAALFGMVSVAVLPLRAGLLDGTGLTSLLGKASDSALDKLSVPNAFYTDTAIRILIPGASGKLARKLLSTGDKLGVTDKLTRSLNDAAGLAAQEAKPIFRTAISGLKLSDVPGIATQKDGATQYLARSATPDLKVKIRPLITAALTKVGAYGHLTKLGKTSKLLGLTPQRIEDSVTDQAMKGIFNYMGKEEGAARGNLVGVGKTILDVVR